MKLFYICIAIQEVLDGKIQKEAAAQQEAAKKGITSK